MGTCSGIYDWQGGTARPAKRPECSRATHARLVQESGRFLFEARRTAYARYSKECRAWGREPMDERLWWQNANGVFCRLARGEKI